MYIIREYLTDETVAIVSRKEDAVAMIRRLENESPLYFEKKG